MTFYEVVKIKEESLWFDAIGFSLAEQFYPSLQAPAASSPNRTSKIKIAFVPQLNTWQGITSVQLKVKDIKYVDDA